MKRNIGFSPYCFFLLFLGFSRLALAQGGPGTTGAVELKIPVGPRAIAMGEAFVAVANDANAIYWNPAGLMQLGGPTLRLSTIFSLKRCNIVTWPWELNWAMTALLALQLKSWEREVIRPLDRFRAAGSRENLFHLQLRANRLEKTILMWIWQGRCA